MYGPVESEVLHALIRRQKPTRIVELGSGFTSLIIAAAPSRTRPRGNPAAMSPSIHFLGVL